MYHHVSAQNDESWVEFLIIGKLHEDALRSGYKWLSERRKHFYKETALHRDVIIDILIWKNKTKTKHGAALNWIKNKTGVTILNRRIFQLLHSLDWKFWFKPCYCTFVYSFSHWKHTLLMRDWKTKRSAYF